METEKSKYNKVQWLKFVAKYEQTNKVLDNFISKSNYGQEILS